MGGGDLNMKKSWHPLLLKNQERVWLEEKKALEERKKLDQLRKEKEEERQLQELQRLQEEKTGKKRTEKLEWMYATPATGNSQNPNDLEDYLLGKKRVDKILTADDNAKLGASHKNFIAVQNANTARDISAKIREDPLLAIKQQQQAALEALMSNPLRLQEMQMRNGIKPKKDKEERRRAKEEKRRLKSERKHMRHRSYSRSASPSRHHRRSPSPFDRRPSPLDSRSDEREDRSYSYRRHSPPRRHRSRSSSPRRDDDDYRRSYRRRSRSRSPGRPKRARSQSPDYYQPSVKRTRLSPRSSGSKPPPPPPAAARIDEDRAARLAAMSVDASAMQVERNERLAKLLEKEKAELAAEELARTKSKGMGDFLSHEQKKVFGGVGGLEDRIRRGRGGMVVDAE